MRTPGLEGIVWCEGRDALAVAAAECVADLIGRMPQAAVALPTGQTPIGLYRQLVARVQARRLDLGRTRVFNLDEYVGLAAGDPFGYAHFLHQHLIGPAAIPAAHVRLIRGDAPDLDAEIRAYEQAIQAAGGLELAILGLGQNGHIAFNEPGADWSLATHLVQLSAETRAVHRAQTERRFTIPASAVSMGIATLRAARRIVLLVAGAKGEALEAWARGVPDRRWPVTSLLGHPDLTVLCDTALKAPLLEALGCS